MQQSAARPAAAGATVVGEQLWAAYLLAWLAAFSDAIGYLTLQQLGASFMSGNSMAMGVAIGRASWMSALNHGLPILWFLLGLALGVLVLMQLRHWNVRPAFAVVFGLEAVCILAFLLVGGGALQNGVIPASEPAAFYGCTALLTLAMGLQTATLRAVGSQGLRTTFITGVLSDATEALIRSVSWLHSAIVARREGQAAGADAQPVRNLAALGGTWVWYVVGAVCGGALGASMSLSALVFPLCALVILIGVDIVRPFDK